MRQIVQLFITFLIILIQCGCNKVQLVTNPNKDFMKQLNSYIDYIDSSSYEVDQLHYIVVETIQKKNTTEIHFWYSGSLYTFIHNKSNIIDFVNYNKHHILFIGDLPKCIIKIRSNKSFNVIEDIGKKYYKKDYEIYKVNPSEVGPTLHDYMSLIIRFKDCNLVSVKRQYY